MSATPEQIADILEVRAAHWSRYGSHDPEYLGSFGARDAAMLDAAAALIRAQSEREKVLVDALRGLFVRLDHPGNGGQHVNYFLRWPEVETARAALAGAQ